MREPVGVWNKPAVEKFEKRLKMPNHDTVIHGGQIQAQRAQDMGFGISADHFRTEFTTWEVTQYHQRKKKPSV